MMSNPIFPDDYDNSCHQRGFNKNNPFDFYQNDESQHNLSARNTSEKGLLPQPPNKKMTKKKGKRENIKVLDPKSF